MFKFHCFQDEILSFSKVVFLRYFSSHALTELGKIKFDFNHHKKCEPQYLNKRVPEALTHNMTG